MNLNNLLKDENILNPEIYVSANRKLQIQRSTQFGEHSSSQSTVPFQAEKSEQRHTVRTNPTEPH